MDLVALGLESPSVIRVGPNGDLFVADSEANTIRVYRVASGSARPVKSEVYASGLNKPLRSTPWALIQNGSTSPTRMVSFASLIKTGI